ncbi:MULTISPECIES: sensor histidine kinase [Metabacillus]|uniref:HAMP domain-containing sensor histidine kinase n=1 Tax=Metabacillus hrfriensis TaxID=3048891 RepID=A0ACD4R5I9_9BACI|nr:MULTISPECIES: HAMP domain-containing sensor histidine kinase [Metabacillus]UAL50237.1 HAMP domain-containing histidine kinase [Metabacillus dongyingensis]USK26479.1 HAMP domain-containing histidine kinase [Bacillus sp. CMF21]WHZ55704.1 HAMP domain-containing sensor histidine kinase [Metabacillus sp. CT-WN-B3]
MTASDELIRFLDENISTFIAAWRQNITISEDDLHQEEVEKNGMRMYGLVKKTIQQPLSSDEIDILASKVALERVEANVNIGDFINNVNLGRRAVISYIVSSGIPRNDLQPYIEEINALFDQFSYFAVKKYTEVKEEILQEKISFIDQSHKERLTILGQMSSSFVHEFRNPLTAVKGFIKLMQNDHPDLKYLDIISHEVDQLNFRVSQFLHASKKETIESKREMLDLSELLDEVLSFMYPSLLDGSVKVQEISKRETRVIASKDELRQVFLNLLLNSIDALQKIVSDRTITIEFEIIDNMTYVHIGNNGPMIPPKQIQTIFEPFFTTKELGTGIGLYICRKIIESHQGTIQCYSDEHSTRFSLSLPHITS